MSNYRFSMAPNISVPRSKFHMPFNHKTSFDHGKLVPIDCFEILPGDEFKADFSGLIRMATPIAPIMDNITCHVHAFFVPMRLVWEHTKEFYGENKTSAGYQQQNYSIPSRDIDMTNAYSVSAYLGKPFTSVGDNVTSLSVLKERGYFLIWNEYYRAQQLQNPVLITLDDTNGIGTITDGHGNLDYNSTQIIDWNTHLMNVCKEFDYFTACTTMPQYGSAVTIPIADTAPVGFMPTGSGTTNNGAAVLIPNGVNIVQNQFYQVETNTTSGVVGANSKPIIADLSQVAGKINDLRYAFQVQKWLERANFGSRFFEMLNLHYGVTSPDARLQRPEYLGGFDFYINVDQVVSMAGYDASTSQEVGQPGAISVTACKNKNLFHKAFVEPGYVYVLISTTHNRTYNQGYQREDFRKDRFDFYFPEFANLGDQEVKKGELLCVDTDTDKKTFGYQEHWAEYRYRKDRVSGMLNPSVSNSLAFWTLSEDITAEQTLGDDFICENRSAISRALTTGANGPDYIGDFHINYTAVREMPLYTIPGLVDHFGVM